MSLRGADSGAGAAGSDANERRKHAERVSFEAAVTAQGARGNGAFEAESVDMSPDGMRLRTVHVPELGERLVCRFDGPDGELRVDAEVVWRNEEAKGGEVGLRFLGLDAVTSDAVRALCKELSGPQDGQGQGADLPRGTRVRLHIDGLASPMKARVREADTKETTVGSNLEFLKLGRSVQLEDVDAGARREVYVDHVKVDIDPATGVPQLVVGLRLDPKPAAKPADARANKAEPARASAKAAPATVSARSVTKEAAPRGPQAQAAAIDEDSSLDAEAVSDAPGEVEDGSPQGIAKVGAKAKDAGRNVVSKVGPALTGFGAAARSAVGRLVQSIRDRRTEQKKKDAPRRTTAPAPGGGLKADGRRLVRDEVDDDLTPAPPKKNRRAALLGTALGLLAVLAVFGITRVLAMNGQPSNAQTAATTAPALPAAPAADDGSPVATANVPLFGQTPLSTTEPIPSAPPSASAAAGAPDEPGMEEGPSGDEGGDADGQTEWGEGSPKNPTILRVKMDKPIEGFNGAKGAMGFTISIPGRTSTQVGSANKLAKKDKRIASLQIKNTPHAAEVTLQFKDGVPAYLVRAKGEELEIALGNEGKSKKAVAKASPKHKPAKAAAKKPAPKKSSKKK